MVSEWMSHVASQITSLWGSYEWMTIVEEWECEVRIRPICWLWTYVLNKFILRTFFSDQPNSRSVKWLWFMHILFFFFYQSYSFFCSFIFVTAKVFRSQNIYLTTRNGTPIQGGEKKKPAYKRWKPLEHAKEVPIIN